MLTWPTSRPTPVDAHALDPALVRAAHVHPFVHYCVDSSGHVTQADVLHTRTREPIEAAARRWTFEPWPGRAGARICESAVFAVDAKTRRQWSRPTAVVYLPVIPPVEPLPADGALDRVPARMFRPAHGGARPFWIDARDRLGRRIEPGFGEITLRFCVDPRGRSRLRDHQLDLDWLAEDQREALTRPLLERDWGFQPGLERGTPREDCDVEVRFAVWVLNHHALSLHDELDGYLQVTREGFGARGQIERAPWAEHDPVRGIDGAPAPSVRTSSWVPPYELAATLPDALGTHTARVRFCFPEAGGEPSEIRVIDSDLAPEDSAVLRLIAEGVGRWRTESTQAPCGEVEWRFGRRPRPVVDPSRR